MTGPTRAQRDMKLAAERVAEIRDRDWAGQYGGLCHNFPVLVRSCGLCQAVAFSAAKAAGKGPLAQAHGRLLQDVEAITGCPPGRVPELDAAAYMLHTRRLLAAWIYYKRFAESLLNAKPGEHADE